MRASKVAKRYAQGLLDFSTDTQSVETVFGEMKDLVNIMNSSKELNSFFATPFIDAKKKLSVASELFSKFSKGSQNFISLVIKHGRETQLKNIAEQYIHKVEDLRGVQRVHLTTASPLDPSVIEQILKSTAIINFSKGFDLTTHVNESLLGGYILRVGDQQIDASVKTKLERLRKDFQLN